MAAAFLEKMRTIGISPNAKIRFYVPNKAAAERTFTERFGACRASLARLPLKTVAGWELVFAGLSVDTF